MSNPETKFGNVLGAISDVAETVGSVVESADKVSSSGGSLFQRIAAGHRRRVKARNAAKAVRLDAKAKRLRGKAEQQVHRDNSNAKYVRLINRAVRAETAASIARDIALGFSKLDGTSLLEPGDTPGRLDA